MIKIYRRRALLRPPEAAALSALQSGYQLIDTANAYLNEKAVGRAMKRSGLPRKDIFLETKLWPAFYEQADAVEKTLARLDTDYIDLLLIHQPAGNYVAGYRLMEKAYKEGKVRAIGLSNFTVVCYNIRCRENDLATRSQFVREPQNEKARSNLHYAAVCSICSYSASDHCICRYGTEGLCADPV